MKMTKTTSKANIIEKKKQWKSPSVDDSYCMGIVPPSGQFDTFDLSWTSLYHSKHGMYFCKFMFFYLFFFFCIHNETLWNTYDINSSMKCLFKCKKKKKENCRGRSSIMKSSLIVNYSFGSHVGVNQKKKTDRNRPTTRWWSLSN